MRLSASSVVQVVVNPVAGRGGQGSAAAQALELLSSRIREAGMELRCAETHQRGDAQRIATRCCEEGVQALVVVGGDGTINEAACGMVGEGVPLLVVPAGTENVLAKYLGIRPEGESLWETLRGGRELRMDIGMAQYAESGGEPTARRFLLMATAGFEAQIVFEVNRRRSELIRRGRGRISYLTYVAPIWRTLWRYVHPRLDVQVDGRRVFHGPGTAMVVNVPRHAMGLRPAWRAEPDDGLLDVCIFRCPRRVTILWHFARVLLRRHVHASEPAYYQGRRVVIQGQGQTVPMQTDGDFAGWLPAEFALDSQRLRLLVPGGFRARAG